MVEDHIGATGEVQPLLTSAGYRVFSLGWRMSGPVLGDPNGLPVCHPYEARSYLATADVADAEKTMGRTGWALFR